MILRDTMKRVTDALHKLNNDEAGTSMIEWAIYAAIVSTLGLGLLAKFFGDEGLGKLVNDIIKSIQTWFTNNEVES